jgi:hypothetical protein
MGNDAGQAITLSDLASEIGILLVQRLLLA